MCAAAEIGDAPRTELEERLAALEQRLTESEAQAEAPASRVAEVENADEAGAEWVAAHPPPSLAEERSRTMARLVGCVSTDEGDLRPWGVGGIPRIRKIDRFAGTSRELCLSSWRRLLENYFESTEMLEDRQKKALLVFFLADKALD